MKIENIWELLVGDQIEEILFCMNSYEDEGFVFQQKGIYGADHGFEFKLRSGKSFYIKVSQINNWFSLIVDQGFMIDSMNTSAKPKLINSSQFSSLINQKIKDVLVIQKVDDYDKQHIVRVKFFLEKSTFSILGGEYSPEEDAVLFGSDEVTIIIGDVLESNYISDKTL